MKACRSAEKETGNTGRIKGYRPEIYCHGHHACGPYWSCAAGTDCILPGNLEQVAMLMTSQWGIPFIGCGGCSEQWGGLHFPFTAFCWWRDSFTLGTGADTGSGWLRLHLSRKFLSRLAVWNTGGGGSNVYVELAIGLLVLRGLKQSEGLNYSRAAPPGWRP